MNHQFVIDTNSLTPKTNLIEGWGNIVTREESTSDFGAMPGAPWMTAPRGITTRFDRLDGRYLPVYQCEQDLAFQRAEARVVAEVCPPAIGAMENLTNYTIGKGFTFTVGRDETADISLEQIQPLVKYAQRVVNEVIDSIKLVGQLDREIHAITREDGETFLNLKLTHEGTIMCQRLWPDQVTEPANFRQLEEYLGVGEEYPISWLFGIGTKEGLPELPLWYHVLYNDTGTDWDCIPEERMVHIKANVPRSAKRGISDYYPVTTWFRKDHKLANNLSETGTIQAAIAFIRQHAAGVTATGVQNINSANKTSQGTVQGSTGSQVRNATHYPAGSILDIANGMQYLAGPTGMGSANPYLLLIQDATLRRIGVRWQMPEYMISGNAANADYSSTKEAGGPFVKAREADQVFYGRHYEELLWKSLKLLFNAGKFDQFGLSWQQFKAMLRINVGYPMVASKDPLAMASAQSILIDKRVMSPRTAAEQQGLDYDQEIENGLAPDPNQPLGSASEDGTSPSGELVGMKLRDATNLDKLRKKYLDAFKAGIADEKETRLSLDSLGYSKEKIDLYLDADPANDPVDVTEAADLVQEKPAEHEYSSTQFNIADGSYTRTQGGVRDIIKQMAAAISDEDLADDGRETEPHVTVKYGIHSNVSSAIRDAVKGFGPVEITLGKTSVFPATKDREYDVVKIDVESPDLHRLNKLIADSTETTDTHPEYKPHVTLAYVKAGKGSKYAGLDSVDGKKLSFIELVFSNKYRKHRAVDLVDAESVVRQAQSAFQEALEEIKADPWKGYP